MTNNLKYFIVITGEIEENCILLKCMKTHKGVIIDPGSDIEKIRKKITETGIEPQMILNTHGHYDHIGAINKLKLLYDLKLHAHRDEDEYFKDPEKNYSSLTGDDTIVFVDEFVSDGDVIKVGELEIKVIHTPGHTKGSVCFYVNGVLVSGDTIFAGSVGRCDLYGGDEEILLEMINQKIKPLPDDTIIIPGHGRITTVGEEKKFNPFLD